ncbi:gastrin/cholecystokinin type B receptor-like [Mizuhopecten yessoensis]|uniref:Alpha-2A adrenergic receptor n=1 Tax=Mizuhopecten yessoensis TaxID=6573 RepID=A0A210QLC9_MIZYE|nr:gastrin/cholecystokinin type B receptor-like [Mizuhopecten yessoensis]XP_021355443.1 gastrin/cholecystokinin type B receptor-like [Mizuhopecten yessoensis]OWF49553.1 Alpha-2A adrenergic receptor [Mizuhopecten yessoensis]
MSLDQKLIALNDDVTRALLPVIIIIACLMVIGFIGNPMVMYFYGCRMKTTPSYMFIVTLAIFDMISCTISMPFEIYELCHFYTFDSPEACRTLRFINYFASIASGATLIAIAVDRYRKICKPFDKQISVKLAKVIIVLVIVFSAMTSWPSLVFYTVVPVNITEDPELVGFDCTTRRDEDFKRYITVYNLILFPIFIISIIVLIVLYSLVGKQLFNLKNFRFYASKRSPLSPTKSNKSEAMTMSISLPSPYKHDSKGDNYNVKTSRPLSLSPTDLESDINRKNTGTNGDLEFTDISAPKESERKRAETKISFDATSSPSSDTTDNSGASISRTKHSTSGSTKDKKLTAQNINTKRYTIITLSISIAFVLSFLPYLSLVTWRTLASDYEPNLLSESAMVAFQLFLRSFLISSASNPVIYGFLNTEFKAMVLRALRRVCCFCCMRKETRDISRSELSGHTGST